MMAAMLNALAISVGVVWVIQEAAQRFRSPVKVPGLTIRIVALAGIGVNTGSALLFIHARKGDQNAKGSFLHMASDAGVSGAVLLEAAGILLTGWTWLDPAVAIGVSLLIALTGARAVSRGAASQARRSPLPGRSGKGGGLARTAGERSLCA